MYRNLKIAVVIPCYNEEKLIEKTIRDLPALVDYVIAVNDASSDNTIGVLKLIKKTNKKLRIVNLDKNQGVGGALISGYEEALQKTDAEAIGIVAGDAQFNTDYLQPMLWFYH